MGNIELVSDGVIVQLDELITINFDVSLGINSDQIEIVAAGNLLNDLNKIKTFSSSISVDYTNAVFSSYISFLVVYNQSKQVDNCGVFDMKRQRN